MDFKIGLQAFALVSMQSKQRIRDARTTKNTWHSKNGYKDKWGRVSDHSIRNAVWAPPPTWLFVKFQNDKQKKIFKKMMIRGNCRLLLSWMEFFFFFLSGHEQDITVQNNAETWMTPFPVTLTGNRLYEIQISGLNTQILTVCAVYDYYN